MLCFDLIREFLEFYRMDYTLSTFIPESSLHSEPRSRADIEDKVGLDNCETSMPLIMHLLLAFKQGVQPMKDSQEPVIHERAPPPANDFDEGVPMPDKLL